MLFKICVLENLAKFTGKHLCKSLFLNKVVDLRTYRTPSIVASDDLNIV